MTLPRQGVAVRNTSQLDSAAPAGAHEEREQVHDLYRSYSRGLVRQLTRATGCRETARDLMHETFVRLMRQAPGSVAKIERPEAFLWHISKNLLRDWGRRRKVAEKSKETLEIANDIAIDQDKVLETRETLRRVEAAIARLSPKTRDIFVAHRIEGMSYAQIAEEAGISVRTVEWHITNAIAKLDRMLDRD